MDNPNRDFFALLTSGSWHQLAMEYNMEGYRYRLLLLENKLLFIFLPCFLSFFLGASPAGCKARPVPLDRFQFEDGISTASVVIELKDHRAEDVAGGAPGFKIKSIGLGSSAETGELRPFCRRRIARLSD